MYWSTYIFEGGNNSGGLFWSNDQASRQLAAHYLQTNNQLNTSNWFGQGHLTFPPSNQTQTSEAGQLPLSVPPGYKLAQDSLTGDILLIPSGKTYSKTCLKRALKRRPKYMFSIPIIAKCRSKVLQNARVCNTIDLH